MMGPVHPAQTRGVALVCDREGVIQQVLRDEFDTGGRLAVGHNFVDFVGRADIKKARNFLHKLNADQAVFDWEMAVPLGLHFPVLHFAGAVLEEKLWIAAAHSRGTLTDVHEELMGINNDQTNALRRTNKELSLLTAKEARRDSGLFDELSRLNNELANLQRELTRKNVELEKLNEQKNQLLGMAAHDLRSPLGVIQTYSEFLESEAAPVLNEEQREFVTTIKTTSQFLLRMINDLLDVSKIESGKLHLDLQPTELVPLLTHNVARNRVLAEKKRIQLRLVCPGELPLLMLDANKIEQVLNNLISNAIKFSHPNTAVQVELKSEGPELHVIVRDHGQGIPREEQAKLFKPFSQTSVKSTAGEHSSGLGLAIVRKIIEGHGGRITVESEVGHGTTFHVQLPRREWSEASDIVTMNSCVNS